MDLLGRRVPQDVGHLGKHVVQRGTREERDSEEEFGQDAAD